MADWTLVPTMLDQFERGDRMFPADAEKLIATIFRVSGHPVTDTGFMESNRGADLFVETMLNGVRQRIAVEVKYRSGPADEASIHQLLAFRDSGHVQRSMIVARDGFTPAALELARSFDVGLIDLLSPPDLRNWLAKYAPQAPSASSAEQIVRQAMRAIAERIALTPQELTKVNWLDLERVLREVFEGLGFETRLTRPAKDGGFDLELTTTQATLKQTYLVEVKHWSVQKPGLKHVRKLVQVTTSQSAAGGLLLSTSGFSKPVYAGLAEVTAPIRIGGGGKIVSLCRTYYRLCSPLWLEDPDLQSTLFDGTMAPGDSGMVSNVPR